jgi:hypothetical protein
MEIVAEVGGRVVFALDVFPSFCLKLAWEIKSRLSLSLRCPRTNEIQGIIQTSTNAKNMPCRWSVVGLHMICLQAGSHAAFR